MNIVVKDDLFAITRWLESSHGTTKGDHCHRDLLKVLLQGCTPYLGYHDKVEAALKEFAEQMIYGPSGAARARKAKGKA